jgi:hypothetical protein
VKPRTAVVAAILLAVCGLTSCGRSEVSSHSTPPALSLLPSADAFTSSVVATRAMGTARATFDVRTSAPSRTDDRRGAGAAVLSSGWGDVTWSSSADTYRELVNTRGIYVQADPPAGRWEQRPLDAPTLTSGYVDALRDLGVLKEVADEGIDSASGVPATRYTGWLPLDARESALLGLTAADLATIPAGADQPREGVTAWVDDFGHIVRVERRVTNGSGDLVRSTATLSDFSLLIDLTSPSDVVTATTTGQ